MVPQRGTTTLTDKNSISQFLRHMVMFYSQSAQQWQDDMGACMGVAAVV